MSTTPEPQEYVRPTEGVHSPESSPESSPRRVSGKHVASEPLASLFIDSPYTLERLFRSEEVVSLVADFLGLREDEIGWNKKGLPFAFGPSLKEDEHGEPLTGIYMLAEVLAWRRTGELRRLSRSQNAVWGKRLFVEMGLLDPVQTAQEGYWLRSRGRGGRWSRSNETWTRLRVLGGFRLLVGISWLDILHSPVTFTREFASHWCGVGKKLLTRLPAGCNGTERLST